MKDRKPKQDTKHIGLSIRNELREKRLSVVWFAGELGCSRTTVYKIFGKETIDTGELLRISKLLRCNFFSPYSDEVERHIEEMTKAGEE